LTAFSEASPKPNPNRSSRNVVHVLGKALYDKSSENG
jgi:hypothetical protein